MLSTTGLVLLNSVSRLLRNTVDQSAWLICRKRISGMEPALLRSTSISPGRTRTAAGVRPVALGVGLLVYLDPLKKRHFLDLWRAAVFRPR